MLLDPKQIRRIVVDAVYTVQQNPQLHNTFRTDKEHRLNFSPNETYIVRHYPQVIRTNNPFRESGIFELHHGLGGSGKTHD